MMAIAQLITAGSVGYVANVTLLVGQLGAAGILIAASPVALLTGAAIGIFVGVSAKILIDNI
jgi:hypothetical protein